MKNICIPDTVESVLLDSGNRKPAVHFHWHTDVYHRRAVHAVRVDCQEAKNVLYSHRHVQFGAIGILAPVNHVPR